MYYGAIKNCDIANGIGVRVTLFVSGCTNHCKGCFQPETWDFDYGEEFTEATAQSIIRMAEPDYINGLTLLGGDPFEPRNQAALLPFVREFKARYPKKTVWAYSGFTYEQMHTEGSYVRTDVTDELLGLCDVLVDGRFILEQKDLSLRFRGSANQRLIDLNKTRQCGEIVHWND